jgi:hypothetical protein
MQLNLVRLCLPLLFFLLGVPSCRFPNVRLRLLDIDIVHDGKLAFIGIWGIRDNTSFKQVWDVLGDVPFEASGDEIPGTTDKDADSVTLTGKVLIRIKHVDKVLAETTVSELKLVRSDGTPMWMLAAGEGQRIRGQVSGR